MPIKDNTLKNVFQFFLLIDPVTGPIIVRGGNKMISKKFHAGK